MEEIYRFLDENSVQYIATIGTDGRPKVRPFMMLAVLDGRPYFAVGNRKDVYEELKRDPRLELAVADPTFRWIRITGKAVFVEEDNFKKRVIEISEVTENIYKRGLDPNFEIFYIDEFEATISNLMGTEKKHFYQEPPADEAGL